MKWSMWIVAVMGCEVPTTTVVLDNGYASSPNALVIYRAFWQAVRFSAPLEPGSASDPQDSVPASANPAYVVAVPGWDPDGSAAPTSFVVLDSAAGFSLALDHTLDILVDDAAFIGDCAAGRHLGQAQADFITQRVFPDVFAGLHYDASTCTTTEAP